MIIRKVGPKSLANVVSSIYVVLGLIGGLVISIVALTVDVPAGSLDAMERAVFSPFAIFWLPIVFGIKGYVVGGIAAWVFNRIAPLWGGLELEVELGG